MPRLAVLALLLLPRAASAQDEGTPFELVSNLIVVKGAINDRPATFILDTGANHTVLLPAIARSLGLDLKKPVCRSISAGPAAVRDLAVDVSDPPQAHFMRKAGVDYAGLLGTSFLEKFVLTVDYENRRVLLVPAASAVETRADGRSRIIPFQLRHKLIFVEAVINERDTATFILDTGASACVFLPRSATKFGYAGEPFTDAEGAKHRRAKLDEIALGESRASDVWTVFSDPPQFSPLHEAGVRFDGVLGYTFLSRFRVTIDYRAGRLRLAPPGEAGRPAPGWTLDETTVREVEPGGPAHRAGIRAGDVIRTVNGQPVRYAEEVEAFVDGARSGVAIEIVVARQGIDTTLKLVR